MNVICHLPAKMKKYYFIIKVLQKNNCRNSQTSDLLARTNQLKKVSIKFISNAQVLAVNISVKITPSVTHIWHFDSISSVLVLYSPEIFGSYFTTQIHDFHHLAALCPFNDILHTNRGNIQHIKNTDS